MDNHKEQESPILPGNQPFLPRYCVLEKLGEGGVATVYKVLDQKGGVVRALKTLKRGHRDEGRAVGRFEEEFRILRGLHHPGFPEMYDYGVTEEGSRYMVMEYVEGEALDRYAKDHREELWLLLYELVEALAFIHEHGLLHLDLKPGNILVRRTAAYGGGEKPLVKLLDFGLSYRREVGGRVSVIGTPGYMAPEIISGSETLTRAVDYYSLGVTIYELIEGRLPFDGSVSEVLRAHLSKEVTFEKEKVEYAELYPRVRALMSKEAAERLEAFEDFRRSLVARVGGGVRALERAYGMGYVESLGLVGKGAVWKRLCAWLSGVGAELEARREEMDLYGRGPMPVIIAEQSKISGGASFGLEGEVGQPAMIKTYEKESGEEAAKESEGKDKRKTVVLDRTWLLQRVAGTTKESGALITVGEDDSDKLRRSRLKKTAPLDKRVFARGTGEIEERIKADLLGSSRREEVIRVKVRGPIRDHPRVVVVSGAGGSGKSYLMEALRGECLLKGMGVVVLGEGSEYQALVAEGSGWIIPVLSGKGKAQPEQKARGRAAKRSGSRAGRSKVSYPVDPRSIIIDRFVRGWERLETRGRKGGIVVIVDGYERTSQEEREFLAYLGKRIEFVIDEGKEPGVFVVASGGSPKLKRDLGEGIPRGEKLEELVIPAPGRSDVEMILAQFHGHMAGVDDRRRLGEYLSGQSESAGAMVSALREALVRGDLEREGGRWRFTGSATHPAARRIAGGDYYQVLLDELGAAERRLVGWLSCHRGSLGLDELLVLTAMSERKILEALEKIRPYRIIEVGREKEGERIGIVSEGVREALYVGMREKERREIHERYVAYYNEKLGELEEGLRGTKRRPKAGAKSGEIYAKKRGELEEKLLGNLEQLYEVLSYHYERVGEARLGLWMRVRALRMSKEEHDVFGMRRLCSDGIGAARRLRGKAWKDRKWHLERYFIKKWIEAEWMVSNYRGIIDVVREHIQVRKRKLPLSFVYKYAMALRGAGEFEACKVLLDRSEKSVTNRLSEPYLAILLSKAALLNNVGKYEESTELLDILKKNQHLLGPDKLSKMNIYYMLNYQELGHDKHYDRYLKDIKNEAIKQYYYDDLLCAIYYEILALFNSALYSRAKIALKKSIRLSNRLRLYYRLCNMYQLLSGVYYEEGNYRQAIKYLNKSMSLALNIGMNQWVNNCLIRHAFINRKMGRFSNAIFYIELAKKISSSNEWRQDYFYIMLELLYLSSLLNNRRRFFYKSECDRTAILVEGKIYLAFYHYMSGYFYYKELMYKDSYEEYLRAKRMYDTIGYKDDAIRSLIKIAMICIENKSYSLSNKYIRDIERRIARIESRNLRAEYYILKLSYYYFKRNNSGMLRYYFGVCEESLESVTDAEIYLAMSSLLFRVSARIGRIEKAKKYFSMYYGTIKKVLSNFNDQKTISSILEDQNLSLIIREFRLLTDRISKSKN